MAAGRPPEYDPRFAEIAKEACSAWAPSYSKLGKLLGMYAEREPFSKSTIFDWRRTYPEFDTAINEGLDEFRSDTAEDNLFKLVKGYTSTEVTVKYLEVIPGEDPQEETEKKDVSRLREVKKRRTKVGPNERAIEYWLNNRRSSRWKQTQKIEHGLAPESPIAAMAESMRPLMERRIEQLKSREANE